MKKRGFTQRGLIKAVHKMAKENGIPFVSRRVEFDNNDAYDFLKKYHRYLARSAKSKLIVGAKAVDDPKGLVRYFEEEGFRVVMLRSRLDGESIEDYQARMASYTRRHKEVDIFVTRTEDAHKRAESSTHRYAQAY